MNKSFDLIIIAFTSAVSGSTTIITNITMTIPSSTEQSDLVHLEILYINASFSDYKS